MSCALRSLLPYPSRFLCSVVSALWTPRFASYNVVHVRQEQFFLTSEELLGLMTDPQTLGHPRLGVLVDVPLRRGEIQLAPVRERLIGSHSSRAHRERLHSFGRI